MRGIVRSKFSRYCFATTRRMSEASPSFPVAASIRDKLTEAFSPSHLEVINESHMHNVYVCLICIGWALLRCLTVSTVCRIGLSIRRRTSRWWSFPLNLILSKLRCSDIVSSIQCCGKSWRDLSTLYPLSRKRPNSGKQTKRLSLPHYVAEETAVYLQRRDRTKVRYSSRVEQLKL